jgi:hypothetical protein
MNAFQMKMLSVVIGCFFLVYAGWSLGQSQASHSLPGGTDWKALSPSEKQIYGAGFTQGYRQAYLHVGAIAMSKEKSPPSTNSAQNSDYEELLGIAQRVTPWFVHRSATGLDSTVTTFYGDYRNMPVCWDDATVLSAAALAGSPATDRELSAARKRGSANGCH